MDTQPFRFVVHDTAGNRLGFVVWSGDCFRAYRYAGQKPIGTGKTLNEARSIVFAYANKGVN